MSTSLLEQLLDPLADSFTRQQAEQIVNWTLDPEARQRLEVLRSAANEGTLSDEEESEYKRRVEELDVIALIQAKARRSLSQDAA